MYVDIVISNVFNLNKHFLFFFYSHGCDLFTCNVLYTHSYVFYSHGCNVFIHSRKFFTLSDTTSIPMGVMYLLISIAGTNFYHDNQSLAPC